MLGTNFQQETFQKIHPFTPSSNWTRKVMPLGFNLEGTTVYDLILRETNGITKVKFYLSGGRAIRELGIFPEESREEVAKFNYYLTLLNGIKNPPQEIYGYLSINSEDEKHPFLGVGVSIIQNYFGIQFLKVDEGKCMTEIITNSSLEEILSISRL